ncbi:hypothetical protein TNCV_1887071 [Trichonephila clavipes]|nr:hypothetical protein TNCV_1887071 [Trichonephila clavipes]
MENLSDQSFIPTNLGRVDEEMIASGRGGITSQAPLNGRETISSLFDNKRARLLRSKRLSSGDVSDISNTTVGFDSYDEFRSSLTTYAVVSLQSLLLVTVLLVSHVA